MESTNNISTTENISVGEELPYLFVVGGYSSKSYTNSCEYYDSKKDKWISVSPMNLKRGCIQAASVSKEICVTGGTDVVNVFSSVEFYNPYTDQWKLTGFMNEKRILHGMAVLDDSVYVAGGNDGDKDLKSVERLNPFSGAWTQIEPMNESRTYIQLVEWNGYLYCMGGDQNKSSMERYDPREGKWTYMASMLFRDYDFGATVYNNHIYVVSATSSQRYDCTKNTWEEIATLQHPRDKLQLVTMNDMLYAVGGYNNPNVVEIYNPHINQWTIGKPLDTARYSHGAVVISLDKQN